MRVKIVTDSTADLPHDVAAEMGITVVPAYVRFGDVIYRDRVDIGEDDFYERLLHGSVHPTTGPPTPQDFVAVYQQLFGEAEAIVSVHVSSKLSATFGAAQRAAELVATDSRVRVVDSELVSMGVGLLSIAAARAAAAGMTAGQVIEEVSDSRRRVSMLGLLDTLKYLALGGRIGKAKALLGSVLSIKPMLSMKAGELEPAGQVRGRAAGVASLLEFVKRSGRIQEVAVVYSTTPEEGRVLAGRVQEYAGVPVRLARLGPALGVHAGPGVLLVALKVE